MNSRPKKSQISMGLFIAEFLQWKGAFLSLELSSLSFQSPLAWCPHADHLAGIIPHNLSEFLHHWALLLLRLKEKGKSFSESSHFVIWSGCSFSTRAVHKYHKRLFPKSQQWSRKVPPCKGETAMEPTNPAWLCHGECKLSSQFPVSYKSDELPNILLIWGVWFHEGSLPLLAAHLPGNIAKQQTFWLTRPPQSNK